MPQWKVEKEKVIEVNGLSVKYGATAVFSKVGLVVEKGDYVGLAGPNGSGKSTLIKAILGLVPAEGEVRIFGKKLGADFNGWNRIGYLPQTGAGTNPLFPATAEEAVLMGRLAMKRFPRRLNAADFSAAHEVMRRLDIFDLRHRLVSELSGGQQQRTYLARALVNGPELLFLDEPSTGLDPEARDDFYRIVGELNRKKGVTVVMITHDTGQIGHYARKLLYFDKQVVFFGSFNDFCLSPEAEKKFGEFAHHLICHQHHPHEHDNHG